MGNPAQYVVVGSSGAEIFYSHWGATELAFDMFWGAEPTGVFVRAHDRAESLHEGIEAGLVLDATKRLVTWFDESMTGSREEAGPAFADAYLPLLHAVWARRPRRGSVVPDVSQALEIGALEVHLGDCA